jgi:hypothetical protein
MRSASRNGRSSSRAATSPATPFSPPASKGMTAVASAPVQRLTARTAPVSSCPPGSFSRKTLVAPTTPTGTTMSPARSDGEWSTKLLVPSRWRSTRANVMASPPPPEPSRLTPTTKASTSAAVRAENEGTSPIVAVSGTLRPLPPPPAPRPAGRGHPGQSTMVRTPRAPPGSASCPGWRCRRRSPAVRNAGPQW